MLRLERLPDRTNPAALDIAAGTLVYDGGSGQNVLTVSVSGGDYTFADATDTITVGPVATALGWTGSGTGTATGPETSLDFITVNAGASVGANEVNVRSVHDPITVNCDSGGTIVNVGSATLPINGTTAGILAPVTVNAGVGSSLRVNGALDTSRPGGVEIQSGGILNFAPADIFYSGPFDEIWVRGGAALSLTESYMIGDPPTPFLRLQTGGGADVVSVTGTVTGFVSLGSAGDTMTIQAGASFVGDISTGGNPKDIVIVLGYFSGTIGP